MSTAVLKQFSATPDSGALKNKPGEYDNLQNIRGFGGFGSKRRGVQNRFSLTSGIMGMFDLYDDGDPTSPNKIVVVTSNGTFEIYDFSEFISIFDYLFATGITLYLQSANSSWWSVAVETTTGIITVAGVAAPVTTLSADLALAQGDLFGFADSTGIWRLYIDVTNPAIPTIGTRRYATSIPSTSYTSTQAFLTGYGPVFQDDTGLQRWRLSVNNSGTLLITSI